MFCMNCGAKLQEGAKFCMNCGMAIGENNSNETKLVPAKCTNCNAPLEVDATQSAAICPYCKTPYIVEQAIHNYNISMNGNMNINNATININNGMNIDNLMKRAQRFEADGNYKQAVEYYNKVLDLDINQLEAQNCINRIMKEIDDYVYFKSSANKVFTFGTLSLKKEKLVFANKNGKETVYFLHRISNPRVTMGCLGFIYDNKTAEITYATSEAKKWVELIKNAQIGVYPEIHISNGKDELADYIKANYDRDSMVKAIKYCREQTGWGLKETKEYVEKCILN
nr:zinc ribbon domain-containing protein [uncultured Agathobacter sp.]